MNATGIVDTASSTGRSHVSVSATGLDSNPVNHANPPLDIADSKEVDEIVAVLNSMVPSSQPSETTQPSSFEQRFLADDLPTPSESTLSPIQDRLKQESRRGGASLSLQFGRNRRRHQGNSARKRSAKRAYKRLIASGNRITLIGTISIKLYDI